MKKLVLCSMFVGVTACGGGGGGGGVDAGSRGNLFEPKPECTGASVTPYAGTHPQVMSGLAIGSPEDGFDLDHDGKPDNKLAGVGSLAQSSIDDSFAAYDILIPLEFFDFDTVGADDCVKFAIYLADYVTDTDGDGKKAYIADHDCNDHDPAIHQGATEIVDDLEDNDCDGLADEDGQDAPNTSETSDGDGDGMSVAEGDCDDTEITVFKGNPEICGDGLDNDCDGNADRSEDDQGNPTACSPYESGAQDLHLDPLSFDANGAPQISFVDGTVDSSNVLTAGPSVFAVNIPVTDGINLDLKITGAQILATLEPDGTTMNGKLGGVIDGKTADTIRGLDVSDIGLTPENSLLDATFANLLGPLLALPKASAAIQEMYPGCRTPDIDVDGDGLEAFCDSNPNDDDKSVDVCIDGDGTVIMDTPTEQCAAAMKDGKPRFVDGISVELNFKTSLVKSLQQPL
jgi:hypothetical protein